MKCPRGFLMVRNMRTGDLRPFFIKVREQDIIWKDEAATRDDIVENGVTGDGWLYETHTLLDRVQLSIHTTIPKLTYVNSRKITATITLPYRINALKSTIIINKFSNGAMLLENSNIEATLSNPDASNLTDVLDITIVNPSGEFTSSNVAGISGMMNILIHGFSK